MKLNLNRLKRRDRKRIPFDWVYIYILSASFLNLINVEFGVAWDYEIEYKVIDIRKQIRYK